MTGGGAPSQVQMGGYPIQLTGGSPSQVCMRGTPSQVQVVGYPIPGPGGGYPIPGMDGGTPFQAWTERGTPLFRPGMGYPHLDLGWGTPIQTWDGIPPGQDWMVTVHPPTRTEWGTPPPPIRRQSSIANTCYAAGGMPLALTQEDFLVLFNLYFLPFSDHVLSTRKGNAFSRVCEFSLGKGGLFPI